MIRVLAIVAMLAGCAHDPAMMRSCARGARVSHACADGEIDPLLWPRLPLVVNADDLGEYRQALDHAVVFWERELGLDLFEVRVSAAADVTVSIGSHSDVRGEGTSHRLLGGRLVASVEYNQPGTTRHAFLALAHALGHVLGLDDDPRGSKSIMASDAASEGWSGPFRASLVTANDRAALRDRYGP